MGCCVSKCKASTQEEHEQNKLGISQSPSLYSSTKIPPSPPSPTSSTSSSLSSKDRSFSNDFLLSCYKHNPHIARFNSLRDPFIPSPPPPQSFSMPHKRLRSNSPTNLSRQKTFRKHTLSHTSSSLTFNYSSTTLTSPSPSTRFNGHKSPTHTLVSKGIIHTSNLFVTSLHSHNSVSSSTTKHTVKPAIPYYSSPTLLHSSASTNTHTRTFRLPPKVHQTVVKDVMSDRPIDLTLMEDIHNPLISLDCFIFL
ncbi:hypothetical protein VNO78_01590 [Psophocarpus tetragonolobus]|uniref:Uncharacterized protein n=1 Tax=Psophocarpus tetragonolobus TaxID=3891 RepID=A0AAN9XV93_PSOTE